MAIDCFWILLGRKMSGESSLGEINELQVLLQTHPDLYFSIEIITNLWKQQGKIDLASQAKSYSGHTERMRNSDISMQQNTSRDDRWFTHIFHGSLKNNFKGNFGIGLPPGGSDCRDQRNN